MEREVLFKIALIVSLIGVFCLVLIGGFVVPEQTKIILLGDRVDEDVSVSGEIVWFSHRPDVSFFQIRDETGEVMVVAFGNMTELEKGVGVSVEGRVSIYKNGLEIIADEIKLR